MNPLDILLVILGYLSFEHSSSNQTGGINKFDLMLSNYLGTPINTSLRYCGEYIHIHLHHWLICFMVYCLMYYNQDTWWERIIMYFCLGGIIQGIINYDDWFKVITLLT